jgi:hypothetical protein
VASQSTGKLHDETTMIFCLFFRFISPGKYVFQQFVDELIIRKAWHQICGIISAGMRANKVDYPGNILLIRFLNVRRSKVCKLCSLY